ncbi:pilus assembly protein TadG-related protein [Lacibacterium aquatile]|uniref:Pilus assembly protein TadG-related protein n=1 Tax=Lacibacterium aquatile TaxID=1168082 RepID=A0ABW5DS81_9PROT
MDLLRRLLRDRRGVFAVMTALLLPLVLALLLIVVDFGRAMSARTQSQGIADTAALTAASHLDRRADALDRATLAAREMVERAQATGGTLLPPRLERIDWWTADGRATNDPHRAAGVSVALEPESLPSFSAGLLRTFAGSVPAAFSIAPKARAANEALTCRAEPLVLCRPEDLSDDPAAARWAGRQMRLTSVGRRPGQLLPLCLADGRCGVSAVLAALRNPADAPCASPDAEIAPLTFPDIKNAITERLGPPDLWTPNAHPALSRYPRDLSLATGDDSGFGNAFWDRAYYWRAVRGSVPPTDLVQASRFQTQLYERERAYAAHRLETLAPPPTALPPEFERVNPPHVVRAYPPVARDRLPSPTYLSDIRHRILTVGLADCRDEAHARTLTVGNRLRMFLTEPPDRTAIYAEVIGPVPNGDPERVSQGRLVE